LANNGKLKACEACGERYSRRRLRCPNCGQRNDSVRQGIPEDALTPSGRVRLRGFVWMASGILLIPPILWLAARLPVSHIRWLPRRWQDGRGYLLLLPFIPLYKGWVEVVTGVRCGVLLKVWEDPKLGWREFAGWLFLLASGVGIGATMIGITMLLKFLGMPVP
jgi:hypothetical protein